MNTTAFSPIATPSTQAIEAPVDTGSSASMTPAGACANCEAAMHGAFCSKCGQKDKSYQVSMGELVHDFVHNYFHLDGKLFRTFAELLLRPGALAVDFVEGRRARHAGPFQVYLIASVLYFAAGALSPGAPTTSPVVPTTADVTNSEEPTRLHVVSAVASGSASPFVSRWAARIEKLDDSAYRNRIATEVKVFQDAHRAKLMLATVPLAAWFASLLFRRRRRFFAEHFVAVMYNYAGVMLLCLPSLMGQSLWLGAATMLAAMGYNVVAFRRYYGESFLRTSVKTFAYSFGTLSVTMLVFTVAAGLAAARALAH